MFARALHTSPHPYMCLKAKEWKWTQDMSFYGIMFRRRSHVSKKFTPICSNHQTSSNLPRNSSKKHLQQIPPSLCLAVEKVEVIEPCNPSAKRWSAVARSAITEAVDTEAAAVRAAEDVHSMGHVAPYRCVSDAGCGRRSARGQLTPAIGLSKLAQVFFEATSKPIDSKSLPKIKSRCPLSQPLGRNLPKFLFFQLPHLPLVVKMGWDAFSRKTHPNPMATTKMCSMFASQFHVRTFHSRV